jgi:precorrin-6B methylase 1
MSDEPVKGGPRLTVVGTGIHPGHATVETLEVMKAATKLFYGSDKSKWVKELRPDAESLAIFREPQKDRYTTYEEMAEHLLSAVRRGDDVAAAFYGDASIATWPAVNAIRRARLEGFPARMLPGVSSLNCLLCELGIDPGRRPLVMACAHDYLRRPQQFSTLHHLLLWQINMVGSLTNKEDPEGIAALVQALMKIYGPHHEVVLYQATPDPAKWRSFIRPVPVAKLEGAAVHHHVGTLYVPPWGARLGTSA